MPRGQDPVSPTRSLAGLTSQRGEGSCPMPGLDCVTPCGETESSGNPIGPGGVLHHLSFLRADHVPPCLHFRFVCLNTLPGTCCLDNSCPVASDEHSPLGSVPSLRSVTSPDCPSFKQKKERSQCYSREPFPVHVLPNSFVYEIP